MSKKKRQRRVQRQKGHRIGNKGYMSAMQDFRRSNATVPIPAGDVNAEPKYRSSRGQHWDDE